jgi:DNA-binding winged helix-turn-helix (wHTH) protein/predicted ATPase
VTAERDIRFGRYRLHPVQGLSRGTQEVHLTPKALVLLRVLAGRAGQVVTKSELLQEVWPRVVVTEASLTTCIQELRIALQDDARQPRYIETVHRRGYRFLGRTDEPQGSIAVAPGAAPAEPIVGRDVALAQLATALARACAGVRQVLFVSGEPGIGKTAMIEAFLAKLAPEGQAASGAAPPRVTRGDCTERYGAGEAYQPLLEALMRLCRQPGSEPFVATLRKFAPTWLAQLPALQTPSELRTLQRRTAGVTPARMLRELTDAIEAMTAHAPIVLLLEDLHWSDVSTLDWISAFARRREPARVLVVGSFRSGERHAGTESLHAVVESLKVKLFCQEVALAGLDERAVVQYVESRFPHAVSQRAALEDLARRVHRHTEGNPLFMVNVLRDLASRGLLVEQGGWWSAQPGSGAASLGIPEDVRRTIEQQFERLGETERAFLTAASVCSSAFSAAAVAAGAAAPVAEVEALLGELARRRLFVRALRSDQWPDGTLAAKFEFLHALYREVLSNRISPMRSAELHRLIGMRLESAWGERAPEIATELAMHFDRARDVPRAITWLQHAARIDTHRSAHREAHVHLQRALMLLEGQPPSAERDLRELELRTALGGVLIAIQGFGSPEVESCYSRARELGTRVGTPAQCFPVLWGLWVYYLDHGPLTTTREIADSLSGLAQQSRDSADVLQAHHAQWATMFSLGEIAATEDFAARGIAVYDTERHAPLAAKYGAHDACVCAKNFVARAAVLAGRTAFAARMSDQAIAHARDLGHPFSIALALIFAAFMHQARRDLEGARARAREAGEISREHSFVLMHGWASVIEGWVTAENGDSEHGIACMREGIARSSTNGASLFLPQLRGVLAEAQLKSGALGDARETLAEARARATRTGDLVALSELDRVSGELILATSGSRAQADAERFMLAAVDRARQQGARLLELRAAASLARSWCGARRGEEARTVLERACAGLTETTALPDLDEARRLIAEL